MVKERAPCCDKSKVKKGAWTPTEDQILTSFIRNHGHTNWRALPLRAGLLRCGKSCRLRWINYLRPDVKRGNFTPDEEQAIINLHNSIGNKWSKIASHFPGRTDNEIKNVSISDHSPTSSYASSSNFSNSGEKIEIPLEYCDVDLWELFDSLDELDNGPCGNRDSDPSNVDIGTDGGNWIRSLENELGAFTTKYSVVFYHLLATK
ncbi:hypothetical protein ABFX02_08G159100 [Erythranthe guttata]